jgi:hypothetical protein
MPSVLRMSDEQVGYVAIYAEIVAVYMLDRGIRNRIWIARRPTYDLSMQCVAGSS